MVGAFEKVDAHCGWVFAVADGAVRRFIHRVAVVAVAQTALHVTSHVVVGGRSHVCVDPHPEVGVGQRLCALVDEDVVVEGHVVDLVVRGEREGLRTDFHPDGLALRLGVHVALVVENPVEVAVAVKWDQIFTLPVFAIDFRQEVVPRVIALLWRVKPVAVVILERRQVVVLVQVRVAVRRIIPEVGRHGVAFRKFFFHGACSDSVEVLAVALRIGTGGDEEVVILVARGGVHFRRSVVGQRTSPVVVAVSPEGDRRELELLVRADAAHPEGTRVQGADPTTFRDFV